MEKWFIKNKKADFKTIARTFGISEITSQIAVNRGISSNEEMKEYLHPNLDSLENPYHMKDMEKAIEILTEKIRAREKIRIIGDYDVDGVMSTYILQTALTACGACVDYEIPDRIKDGYGINISIVEAAYEDGVNTIITCDNGIAALSQIERAKELGLTVIITDHHDIPYEENEQGEKEYHVPNADAVVNPKQIDCSYQFKNLCGAAVCYTLVKALYEKFQIPKQKLDELLEFVAIATVCDVMDLMGENRTIVKHGLRALEKTTNPGLCALMKENNLLDTKLTAYHIGFVIGPCINASGRLESAKLGLKMLLTKEPQIALEYAKKLKELNEERKELTNKGIEDACEQVEKEYLSDSVLVVYLKDCHESIAGIIAGRIRERYNKPAIVLTKAEHGVKGSGRSIEAYHMFDKLNECKEVLDKFGGHPLAAGLSLAEENVDLLRIMLNERSGLSEDDFVRKVSFDTVLPFKNVTIPFIRELELLEPYGKANEKPLFALKDVLVMNAKVIGKNNNVLKMTVQSKESNMIYTAMLFQNLEGFENQVTKKYGASMLADLYAGVCSGILMDFVFYPNINEYNGVQSIQFVVQHFR